MRAHAISSTTHTDPGEDAPPCADASGHLPAGCPGWCAYAAPPPPIAYPQSVAPIELGTRIAGGFTLEGRVGQGAMGEVFAARDELLQRMVAIKILHPHVAQNLDAYRRFVDEGRVMARVDHPHVVRVHAHGIWRGHPYLVMEFIPGRSLHDLLATASAVPVGWALRVLGSVALGVDAVHRAGAVHGDVTATNVLIGRDGRVALGDFGLARPCAPVCRTAAGMLAGTPAYLAPELARGDHDRPDPAVDIYALGVLAFEVLTGSLPFAGDDVATLMHRHVHEDPPRATSRRADLPAAIDPLLASAMAKDPAQRPKTAGAFAAALYGALV